MTQEPENWERKVLEKVAMAAVQEQRRSRQWGIFFKLLGFGYLFLLLFLFAGNWSDSEVSPAGRHTAVVDLKGVIAANERASADLIIEGLRNAYADKNTAGVILRINSPGGSPVQASYINAEMRRLRALHPNIPLYAVVEDICASGGYYVAVAADRIYVNPASLVGSIGVLMDGFGFTDTMKKLGVERRLLTAGENKGFLDPFSPENPQQKEYALSMLKEIHGQFIQAVREGRGNRLHETPDMFSGLIWTGERAVQMGLADAYGSTDDVARNVIKAEKLVDYTPHERWSDRLAKQFGVGMSKALDPLEAWTQPFLR